MGASCDHRNNQDQMIFLHQQQPPSANLHRKNDHSNDDHDLNHKTVSSSSSSSSSSSRDNSTTIGSESSSSSSCSDSLDLTDDATSSSSSSSSSSSYANLWSHHHGSMFELSDLMASLPIKRGLSKFYQGKSQSFTSLTRVTSIEDLVKKENPYQRRKMLKGSKSYANGLDACRPYTLHKSMISKQNKAVSFVSSSPAKKGSLILSRPPIGPCVQNKI